MTQLNATGLFAALRCALKQTNPGWMEASAEAWRGWYRAAGKALPRPGLPQVAIVARIHCADDILLHRGLLQLLSLGTIQPLVLFALPTASAVEIVRGQALREGWASLLSLLTEAELDGAIRQLPGAMPIALFPRPAPISQSDLEGIATTADKTAGAWVEPGLQPDSAFLGSACDYSGLGIFAASSFDDSSVPNILKSLEDAYFPEHHESINALQSEAPQAIRQGSDDRDQEIWIRPAEVELPSVRRDQLLTVMVLAEGQEGQVTAVQPVSLALHSKGLSLPLLPRHASEAEQRMQILTFDSAGPQASHEVRFNVPPANIEPWMLSAFLNRGGAGNPVVRAFAMGAGCRLAYAEDEPDGLSDIPVVWGVLRGSDRILAQARAQGLHFFYIDHAYFDRGHGNSYRITRNRYEAGNVRKLRDDRFKQLDVDILPWRKNGRSIIVCPPTEYFAKAHDCADWLDKTLAALRLETDRPVIVREKPKAGQPFVPLAEALQNAHALVTHSSNVAIEAACLGTPVFVSPASAAAPIGRTDIGLIETPRYPKRDGWLAQLAYSQFSIDEIRDGTAWKLLKYFEDREFV